MNNLKRVLSLGLSGVMLAGLLTVGASAADFTDADKIQHQEAVDVLVALGVINGKDDGSYFDPEGDVTRAEMAKMIATAMQGGNNVTLGVKTTPTFTDIKGKWYESYIEYCYDLGIINGRGDGTFDPEANVTTIEATKMVLTALGYDARAYELLGASWSTNTDELARKTEVPLYEDLAGVSLNANATRDTAAQILWNGLQSDTRYVKPNKNTSTGETTWTYEVGDPMLYTRFGAQTVTGTYIGNTASLDLSAKGSIRVVETYKKADGTDGTRAYTFPSTMGLENCGEEVKVIYKNTKDSQVAGPDSKDVIYGVFNTGKTVIYNTTRAKLADDAKSGKIGFDDATYDVDDNGISVVINHGGVDTSTATYGGYAADALNTAAKATAWFNAYSKRTGDAIKFIANDDGELAQAWITESTMSKVTSVTSEKITLLNVGAIDLDENEVYEGVAKNDVVVCTRLFNTDPDDATFVVAKAEAVEGELTRYMSDNEGASDTKNVSKVYIDGEGYSVDAKSISGGYLPNNLSDDPITKPEDKIGADVRLYMINGYVGAIQELSDTEYNYALVISSNGQKTLGVNTGKVQLLRGDNTKATYNVDADSKVQADALTEGTLVKYSIDSDGELSVSTGNAVAKTTKSGLLTYWNADTKNVYASVSSATVNGVASGDCVMFVRIDNSPNNEYKAYNVRNLRTFTLGTAVPSSLIKNGSDQVVAAYVEADTAPGGGSNTIVYGVVVAQNGAEKIGGDYYSSFDIWTADEDEPVTIYIKGQVPKFLSKGQMYAYDRTADNKYSQSDFSTVLSQNGKTILDVAVKEYDEKDQILSFYRGVKYNAATKVYEGNTVNTRAVDDNVKIIYYNANDKKAGADIGVNHFIEGEGWANAKIICDSSDVIQAIFVESSLKCDINGKDEPASAFMDATDTTNTTDANISTGLTDNKTVTVQGNYSTTAGITVLGTDADTTLIVNGNLTLGAAQSVKGTLIVNGDLDTTSAGLDIVGGGKVTVTGDVTNTNGITVTDGTLTTTDSTKSISKLTVVKGNVTVAGTVTELADVTDAAAVVNLNGPVTKITNVTNGTVTVKGTTAEVVDISGGTVTFDGSVTKITDISAGTVNINKDAELDKTGSAITLTGGAINIGAKGNLKVGASNKDVISAATIKGVTGATITVGSNKATVAAGQLYKANGTDVGAADADAGNYIWKAIPNAIPAKDGFVLTV